MDISIFYYKYKLIINDYNMLKLEDVIKNVGTFPGCIHDNDPCISPLSFQRFLAAAK